MSNIFGRRKGGATINGNFYGCQTVSQHFARKAEDTERRAARKMKAKKHYNLEHMDTKHWGSRSPFTRLRRKANTQKRFDRHLRGMEKIHKLLARAA